MAAMAVRVATAATPMPTVVTAATLQAVPVVMVAAPPVVTLRAVAAAMPTLAVVTLKVAQAPLVVLVARPQVVLGARLRVGPLLVAPGALVAPRRVATAATAAPRQAAPVVLVALVAMAAPVAPPVVPRAVAAKADRLGLSFQARRGRDAFRVDLYRLEHGAPNEMARPLRGGISQGGVGQ
jgi:hypothetical protein